jgi:prepilin-type N-terminal cleavage/methylation domain-containing protein
MNKRGVTLVELLGAIVIFGIVAALTAIFFSLYATTTDQISRDAKANSDGMLAVATIEEAILDFESTTYSTCGVSCAILTKQFAYVFDSGQNKVVLVTYSPAQTLRLQISGTRLLINGTAYGFQYFTLDASSSLSITETAGMVYVVVHLVLVADNGDLYPYIASRSFEKKTVPAS